LVVVNDQPETREKTMVVGRDSLSPAASALLCAILCLLLTPRDGWAQDSRRSRRPSNQAQRFLQRISRLRLPDEHERNHPDVRAAFREVVRPANHSTVHILADGIQVALGCIVRSDGYILTKASQLETAKLQCYFRDGKRLAARVVIRDDAMDLALLKVEATDLTEILWSDELTPAVGSWLATTGLNDSPTAIGIVSAPLRSIPRPPAVLGVRLNNSERGPLIGFVFPRSPAARAGLKSGDVVIRLGDDDLPDRDALIDAIGLLSPGDDVQLAVLRNGKRLAIKATLGDKNRIGNPEQAELMESLGGPLSKRRYGFSEVLQHDSVLRPRDCGGPLVGLDGKVVGMNIARASRVASYALPARQVQSWLDEQLRSPVDRVARDGTLEPVSLAP
jgi:serine protease Do